MAHETNEEAAVPQPYAMLGAGDSLGNQVDHEGPDELIQLPPKIHAFEERGLGKAPFICVASNKGYSLHACDYCSTGIKEIFVIKSADNRTFIVGNVCVFKTGDRGLIDTVKREMNRLRTEERNRKADARIAAALPLLNTTAVQVGLSAQPHPNEFFAAKGLTLHDHVRWLFEHAGRSGRLRAAKLVEQAMLEGCE